MLHTTFKNTAPRVQFQSKVDLKVSTFTRICALLPEKTWSWRRRGRPAGGTKPCKTCGSITCARRRSRRERCRGSTRQLRGGEVKRTGVTQTSCSVHTPGSGAERRVFFPWQPGLCSEKKPCLEMGCLVRAGRSAHAPFFFFGVCFCRRPRQAGPGFWLAERILLWCRVAHNSTTVGMAIVLCLPRRNNTQLSIAERERDGAELCSAGVETKLGLFRNSSHASILVFCYRCN